MTWVVVLQVIVVLALLDLVIHLFYATVGLRHFERRPPLRAPHATPDLSAELVEFETTDNLLLRGALYRATSDQAHGIVIFCPEIGSNHWSVNHYARILREAGFHLFSFDFRNQGASDSLPTYEPLHWLTEFEVNDALAAIDYVQSQDDLSGLPIGLMGVSRGAGAALVAAAHRREICGVIAQGAYSTQMVTMRFSIKWVEVGFPRLHRLIPDWHVWVTMRLARWISQLKRGGRFIDLETWMPRLRGQDIRFVAGDRDNYIPPAIPRRLASLASLPEESVLVVRGAKHNLERETDPERYDRFLCESMAGFIENDPISAASPSTGSSDSKADAVYTTS